MIKVKIKIKRSIEDDECKSESKGTEGNVHKYKDNEKKKKLGKKNS